MTKRERREAHAWRRCGICGRFIAYADISNHTTDNWSVDPCIAIEPPDPETDTRYHKSCWEKEYGK